MRRVLLIGVVASLFAVLAAGVAWAETPPGEPDTGVVPTTAPPPSPAFDYTAWALKWERQAQRNVAAYNRVAHLRGAAVHRCPHLYAVDALHLGRAYKSIAYAYAAKAKRLRAH